MDEKYRNLDPKGMTEKELSEQIKRYENARIDFEQAEALALGERMRETEARRQALNEKRRALAVLKQLGPVEELKRQLEEALAREEGLKRQLDDALTWAEAQKRLLNGAYAQIKELKKGAALPAKKTKLQRAVGARRAKAPPKRKRFIDRLHEMRAGAA